MRRVISAALAMVMVMAISIPAFAIDKEREVSRLAYMNLDQASEAMQEKILQAREEIIFSKSWVADGLQGFVYDKDGNVIEEVPQFSEIFPADWDMTIAAMQLKPQMRRRKQSSKMDVSRCLVVIHRRARLRFQRSARSLISLRLQQRQQTAS